MLIPSETFWKQKFQYIKKYCFKQDYNNFSEKAMAPHSSTLAWKIPWTEEPGRLQSMGSRRVKHNWATSLSRFTFMHWRRKWQPTPVFLPGESQGRGSLVGCRLWGRTSVGHQSDWSDLAAAVLCLMFLIMWKFQEKWHWAREEGGNLWVLSVSVCGYLFPHPQCSILRRQWTGKWKCPQKS